MMLMPSLRKTKRILESTNNFGPHGITATLGSLNGIFVFLSASQQILHAFASRAPDQVLVCGQFGGGR
jgi:hypothetical protein